MYTLDNFAVHAVTSPENTYIYDILPTALGLVSISSDDKLRLLDPLNLGSPAVVKKANQDVTSLRVLSDEGVVVTGGRDGRVEVLDLRSSGKNVAKSEMNNKPPTVRPQLLEGAAVRAIAPTPILSLACSSPYGIAAGTELTNHQATVLIWDTRKLDEPAVQYVESHSDDITELQFHPSRPQILLSGSTDGLVNIYNVTITDEEEALHQTINHGASIHHANFLSDVDIFALSHDEKFSTYELVTNPEEGVEEPAPVHYGDLREGLGGEYVANAITRPDGSAVLGIGTHSRESFDLIQLKKSPPWNFVPESKVTLTGAHGSEIVRAFCFLDSHQTVFTAGEDGQIKAWRSD